MGRLSLVYQWLEGTSSCGKTMLRQRLAMSNLMITYIAQPFLLYCSRVKKGFLVFLVRLTPIHGVPPWPIGTNDQQYKDGKHWIWSSLSVHDYGHLQQNRAQWCGKFAAGVTYTCFWGERIWKTAFLRYCIRLIIAGDICRNGGHDSAVRLTGTSYGRCNGFLAYAGQCSSV